MYPLKHQIIVSLHENNTMRSITELGFHNVWNSGDSDLTNKVAEFWSSEVKMDYSTVMERIDQIVYVILDKEGEVRGVSTAVRTRHDPLNTDFWLYRCFISEKVRAPALDTVLLIKTRDFLEELKEGGVKGLILVAQHPFLKAWNKAVWPDTEMMYVGNTLDGDPVRIYYFKGARV